MSDGTSSVLTTAETKFVLAVLKHIDGGAVKFNAEAVAQELGMKNVASVRARWNTINRNKIQNDRSAKEVPRSPPSENKVRGFETISQDSLKRFAACWVKSPKQTDWAAAKKFVPACDGSTVQVFEAMMKQLSSTSIHGISANKTRKSADHRRRDIKCFNRLTREYLEGFTACWVHSDLQTDWHEAAALTCGKGDYLVEGFERVTSALSKAARAALRDRLPGRQLGDFLEWNTTAPGPGINDTESLTPSVSGRKHRLEGADHSMPSKRGRVEVIDLNPNDGEDDSDGNVWNC